tara:strand:+ start:158 stop:652 length:495 start_codon:yes stop_codon:yes gene_type:complete
MHNQSSGGFTTKPMDEDSRIQRLRECVKIYLKRLDEVDNEQLRIQLFSEKSAIKSGKSQINSGKKFSKRKDTKNKFSNESNKARNKIFFEEIGRNLHTVRQEPHQYDEIYDDVIIDSYPVENGTYASVSSRDGSQKKSKIFLTPEEAENWMRITAQEISNAFTQ